MHPRFVLPRGISLWRGTIVIEPRLVGGCAHGAGCVNIVPCASRDDLVTSSHCFLDGTAWPFLLIGRISDFLDTRTMNFFGHTPEANRIYHRLASDYRVDPSYVLIESPLQSDLEKEI